MNNFVLKTLPDKVKIKEVAKKYNISLILSALLLQREISDISLFLEPDYKKLLNPFNMKDMDLGTNILHEAKDKRVWVFGDYDVDGMTSCAILVTSLQKLGFNVKYLLPDRLNHGYDLNTNSIDYMFGEGCDLLITCDCGSNAVLAVDYAKSKGIKVIVTDHHAITTKANPHALINPNQEDCNYQFKKLCGAGVAYKFILAYILKLKLNGETFTNSILEFLTLGTIADIVPLIEENRILVKLGLKKLEITKKLSFQKLLRESYLFKNISAKSLQFNIIPKLNSASRMGQANKAYDLLVSNNFDEVENLYTDLIEFNAKRLKIEETMYNEAKEIIAQNAYEKDNFIVVYKADWIHTIVGNIAGKLSKEYNRPVIAIGGKDDLAIGSGRQKNNIDILELVAKCEDILVRFGGHKSALGVTIDPKNINIFRQRLNENFQVIPSENAVDCDLAIKLESIDLNLCKELEKLTPYGEANEEPIFLSKNLEIKQISNPGKENQHTKMVFEKKFGEYVEAVYWNYKNEDLKIGTKVNLAYTLNINNFNYQENPQMVVKGLEIVF